MRVGCRAASAARNPGADADLFARLRYALSSIVSIRHVGSIKGSTPDAILARAQALLEHLDRWLAERDTEPLHDQPGTPRVRLGLGIYHIEAPEAPTFPKEN